MTTHPSTRQRRAIPVVFLLLFVLLALPVRSQIAELRSDAEPLESSGAEFSSDQTEATPSSSAHAASCAFGGPGHDQKNAVWHSYVAPSDGMVSVTVAGADVDLILTIMDASRSTELACADEERLDYRGGLGFEAIADFPVSAGVRYDFRTTTRWDGHDHNHSGHGIDLHTDISFHPNVEASNALSLATSFSYPTLDSATLTYTLAEPGSIQFKVYDPQGRLVRSFVNEGQAAGRHEVVFQTGDLTPGIYTIETEHQGQVQTQHMRLTR